MLTIEINEADMDPFTLGKEKAATHLAKIIGKIGDSRNRLHALRWTQTILSRFGRGLNAIRPISNCHARTEVTILWRKHWVGVVDKKASVAPEVKSHIRSIIHARTKEIIRESTEAIVADKEVQRKSTIAPRPGV